MRKLLCILLCLTFLVPLAAGAEGMSLSLTAPSETIRPGKAFLLTFTTPQAGSVDLFLRDEDGETVMNVITGYAAAAGQNQLWWNGTTGGESAPAGVYQLVLAMSDDEAVCTIVIGAHAPYLTSINPVKDAQEKTMTVDFYASVDGLLTVGLWSGSVWALLENKQVAAGMNSIVWDASAMEEDTFALTLTLTDETGFSSNEEHVSVSPADFGIEFATPTPEAAATPVPQEPTASPVPDAVITPMASPSATPAPTDDHIDEIVIDTGSAKPAEEIPEPTATPTPEPTPTPDIVFTPSYGSAYPLTEADEGTYWGTPMDITDEEAIWQMLSAPITVVDNGKKDNYKGQTKVYAQPDEDSRTVAVVTGSSQGVRVIEHLDNGWSLIELYSSTFHDNSIEAWNMLVQGYVKTSTLETREVTDKYGIVVDKLTQRAYLFSEEGLVTTLLVSTGLANAKQPYNETRSGEFLYISATGGFQSDNMYCPMAMKFNDGDLLHEVPYVQRYEGGSKIYTATEPYLGQRASHGCIRVQRKKTPEGINMKWIWDNRKDIGRIVIWEDWQGRQIEYPADDTLLYYNANGGSYYHKAESCYSAKSTVTFSTFTWAELDTGDFAKLEFCPYCAPALRRAQIDEINLAHAFGGDHDPVLTQCRQEYIQSLLKKISIDKLLPCELRYYTPPADAAGEE